MPNCHNVALEAVTEAMNILQLLANVTFNDEWLTGSVPLQRLDELATSLGYPNARAIHSEIEGDREHEANKHRDFDGPQLFG